MATSTSGIQLATQSAWQQFKLSMAERSADQAQQRAQSLRAEADVAQGNATRAQENARSLQVEADQAQTTAGEARRGVATAKAAGEMGTRLAATYDRLAKVQATALEPVDTSTVVNSQGQVTGQVVSEAA